MFLNHKQQYAKETFEDIKRVFRYSKLKDRQYNYQKKNDNDLQNTAETKDWATRTPLKTGG